MHVIDIIGERYGAMSRVQKKIAEYLINNPDEACFLSMKKLSEKVGTTEVTIMNFTRKLGYDSFLSLKNALQAYISMRLSPSEKMVSAITSHHGELKSMVDQVYRKDMDAIQRTYSCLNHEDIRKVVDMLKGARRIYLAAHNASKVVTMLLYNRLQLLGLDVVEFVVENSDKIALQMLNASQEDVFLIVAYPEYQNRTLFLCQLLHKKGIPLVCITDRMASPVAKHAQVTLVSATDSLVFFNSYAAPIMLANIVASVLAIELSGKYMTVKDEIRGSEQTCKEMRLQLSEIDFLENWET